VAQEITTKERVDRLLKTVKGSERAVMCTHDNPDPDSIASAFALGRLLESRLNIPFDIAYSGVLGRAENREMVRALKIPMLRMNKVNWNHYDVVGLVDTQVGAGNHSLPRDTIADKNVICIDHHPARPETCGECYADIGRDYGATSTVLTTYLHAANVEPDESLATALFYGIKSDTRDLGREASDEDIWAYSHLVSRTNMAVLSAIENPRLPRAYFHVLMRAIQSAVVYDNVVVCDLGEAYVPDLVPETADRLLDAESMRWSIVAGEHNDHIFVSLRVSDRRFSAGKLVREVVEEHYPEGSAGGHGSMAGACIPFGPRAVSDEGRRRIRRKLLKRLAFATGIGANTSREVFANASSEREFSERLAKKDKRQGDTLRFKAPPKSSPKSVEASPKTAIESSRKNERSRKNAKTKSESVVSKATSSNE